MHSIDLAVQSYLIGIRTPQGVQFMYLLTKIFDVFPLALIILCLAVFIYKKRGLLYSGLFVLSIAVADGIAWVLKHLTNIDRPIDAIILKSDGSFPSGHATATTVFFGMLMFIFADRLEGYKKKIFNTFSVLMVIIVAFSRLYLGVHWLSDVLAGIALGILVIYISVKIFKKYDNFVG
jgi:undecaprenyl-diphosphatase